MPPAVQGLYLIADTAALPAAALVEAVEAAIRGGARLVQYRHKGPAPAEPLELPGALLEVCRGAAVPFIVNDDLELARALGADGVHLGRGDADLPAARSALGPSALLGASCYNELPRALAARREGADYVAFGSFFPSPTKPGAVAARPGLLRRARERLDIPIVAIGGITPPRGARLIGEGATALAVISGVLGASDPEAAARAYACAFDTAGAPRAHA